MNESIKSILADIKSNTNKNNIQTKDENKVKLKEIADKLKEIQKTIIPLFHNKKTTQLKLI